eukprot:6212390-Pleurochrysis_carterae.AAC.5
MHGRTLAVTTKPSFASLSGAGYNDKSRLRFFVLKSFSSRSLAYTRPVYTNKKAAFRRAACATRSNSDFERGFACGHVGRGDVDAHLAQGIGRHRLRVLRCAIFRQFIASFPAQLPAQTVICVRARLRTLASRRVNSQIANVQALMRANARCTNARTRTHVCACFLGLDALTSRSHTRSRSDCIALSLKLTCVNALMHPRNTRRTRDCAVFE